MFPQTADIHKNVQEMAKVKPKSPQSKGKLLYLLCRKVCGTSHRQTPCSAIGALGQALASSAQASLKHKGRAGLLLIGKERCLSQMVSALNLGKASTHMQAVCPPVATCMQYMKLPLNVPGLGCVWADFSDTNLGFLKCRSLIEARTESKFISVSGPRRHNLRGTRLLMYFAEVPAIIGRPANTSFRADRKSVT